MAYVKTLWRKDVPKKRERSAGEYEKYLLAERGTELVLNSNDCLPGIAVDQFTELQHSFGKYERADNKTTNIAFEVIQSFSPEESEILTPKQVNRMGTDLAKRYFPSHQFMVVTHTDTDKLHNHILG